MSHQVTLRSERTITVPDYGTYLDENDLIRLTHEFGSHFFDPDTMRLFRSRLHDIVPAPDGWYIITSEKREGPGLDRWIREPRRYTVRRIRIDDDLHIDGLSTFQEYPSLGQARTRLQRAVIWANAAA